MRYIFLLSVLVSVYSCSDQAADTEVVSSDTTFIKVEGAKPTIEDPVQYKNLVWSAVFDSVKGGVILKQQRQVRADTLTADKLIKEINASWEGIKLEFRKISHDTIYVAIPESSVLTQQMGSSGAYSYVSSTTFTLTELNNIKFVNYNFEEGDHLAPGTMKRADFKN